MNNARENWMRWWKFNAVGGMGIVVQLAVLTLLKGGLGVNYLLATALAVEATVIHNFFWHERYTWADRPAPARFARFAKFNLTIGPVSIVGNLAFTDLFVRVVGLGYLPANGLAIIACSLINFLVNDRMVFVKAE